MIIYSNVVVLIYWGYSVYSKEDLIGVLVVIFVCFDFLVFEIFVILVAGGKIIFVENVLVLLELFV